MSRSASLAESVRFNYPPGFLEKLEEVDITQLITFIASKIIELTNTADTNKCRITCFTSKTEPPITIEKYMQRMGNIEGILDSPSNIVTAYIFLMRFSSINPDILSPLSVHRLLALSVYATTKCTDLYYKSTFYAELFGINWKEVLALERAFLFARNNTSEIEGLKGLLEEYPGLFIWPEEFYDVMNSFFISQQEESRHQAFFRHQPTINPATPPMETSNAAAP